MKGLSCLFFNSLLSIILQKVFGRYILLDINPTVEKGVESRAESSEDLKQQYKNIIEDCIRKNDISERCVESINTGKIEKDCLESCTNSDCVEKLEKCLLEIKELKDKNLDCKKFKETNKGIGGMDKVVCNQRGYKFYRDTSCTGWPMGNDYPPMFYHSLEEAIVKCNSITRCGCIRAPFCTSVNGSGVWFTLYYGVEFDETDIPECTWVKS